MSITESPLAVEGEVWAPRRVRAMTAEQLAALVDSETDRVEGLLFTATAREDLTQVNVWQQLKDQAAAGQLRTILAMLNRAAGVQREFVPDEIALALGVGVATAGSLAVLALQAGELPGLLESLETNLLTERHLRLVVEELHQVPLTLEQRQAITLVLLARYRGETPGELRVLLRRLILTVDPVAARQRKQVADRGRSVSTYPTRDGQGALCATGPLEQIAQIRAALEASLASAVVQSGDERGRGEREFDLLVELICGHVPGSGWQVQVVMPLSTVQGGEVEVAEIPGFGPILPSTARDLAEHALSLSGIAVDATTGEVLGVTDQTTLAFEPTPNADASAARQQPAPSPCPYDEPDPTLPSARLSGALDRLLALPVHVDPVAVGYRVSPRLGRFLEARDRTCVFPGCHKPAMKTDKDHRIPWPRGRTTAANMQCLCRRHHRAKQASFTVQLSEDGDYLWTTRGRWVFHRRPQGY